MNTKTEKNNDTCRELSEMCENYRDELRALERGRLYENGEGDYEVLDNEAEDREPVSLRDWIDQRGLGDIRFEVNSNGECDGTGRILLCFGGPNVWLHDDHVVGHWGTETVRVWLNSDTADMMSDFFSEEWDLIREGL